MNIKYLSAPSLSSGKTKRSTLSNSTADLTPVNTSDVVAAVESGEFYLDYTASTDTMPFCWICLNDNHKTSGCQEVKNFTSFIRTRNLNFAYWGSQQSDENKIDPNRASTIDEIDVVCGRTADILRQLAEVSTCPMAQATTTKRRTPPNFAYARATTFRQGKRKTTNQPGPYRGRSKLQFPPTAGIVNDNRRLYTEDVGPQRKDGATCRKKQASIESNQEGRSS